MPALVAKVLVQEGDMVRARQTLVVLQAMKMEHLVQAAADGKVKRIRYREGDSVPEGATLVELESD
jgi:3-methylcrotonyl-CoA carboxylase alpha subunit